MSMFQFHIGAIKIEPKSPANPPKLFSFNSILVRLKLSAQTALAQTQSRFNSILVRLKCS